MKCCYRPKQGTSNWFYIFAISSSKSFTDFQNGVRTCTYFATHANWCPSREHTIFCAENSKLSTHGSHCIPNIIGPNCSSARYWHAAYWSGGVTARVDSWRGSMYTVPFYACWDLKSTYICTRHLHSFARLTHRQSTQISDFFAQGQCPSNAGGL